MPELRIAVRLSALGGPLKQSLLTASRLGARGVEIDARTEIRPAELTDTAARQLLKMLDDLNLRVSSIRFSTRRGYDVAADLDRRIDATKGAMRMAYRLGAAVVVNQVGRAGADPQSAPWQTMKAACEDLGHYGARVGAFLAAETGSESGESLAKLLEALPEVHLPIAFNPGNLIVNGFSPGEALTHLGAHVALVAARDGVQDLARGRGIEVPLGEGTADFPELLGRLEDHRYRGWFVVGGDEPTDPQEIGDALRYLTEL